MNIFSKTNKAIAEVAAKVMKENPTKVEAPQVVAEQIKQKFGTLRFYHRLEYDATNLKLAEKYPHLKEINTRYANYIDGI